MISAPDAITMLQFSRDEERLLAKLEAAVDSKLASPQFTGGAITLEFKQSVDHKIANALARKYETEGHWRAATQIAETFKFSLTPVFFTPPRPQPVRAASTDKVLPPVLSIEPAKPGQRRLLIRMPTRGRPAQALDALAKYRAIAGCPVIIEVVIDSDDETMLDPRVLQRLRALECVVTVGKHDSKIAAVNDGRITEWDVLLLASDDMMPVVDGFAVRVLEEMEKNWPQLDGAIYFSDGFQGSNLVTLPIIGRRFYDRFGYVYHPSYKSLFSDTEQTILWTEMGRLRFIDEVLIEHRHHIWGKSENDALYKRNDALWNHDHRIYEERKKTRRPFAQFAFNTPPLFLSICIATLPSRRAQLIWLVDELYLQIHRAGPGNVEVLIDSGDGTIGEKRQRLIERSKALFVCFVDDDDGISDDYIWRLIAGIGKDPTIDCLSLVGMMTTAGGAPERFEHSIKHQEWSHRDGVHLRGPNHLNPVRRDLALKAGFPSKSHSEDFEYSKALRPLLEVETDTGPAPSYFYFYWPAKS